MCPVRLRCETASHQLHDLSQSRQYGHPANVPLCFRLSDGDDSDQEANQDECQYRSFNYMFHDCLFFHRKESNSLS